MGPITAAGGGGGSRRALRRAWCPQAANSVLPNTTLPSTDAAGRFRRVPPAIARARWTRMRAAWAGRGVALPHERKHVVGERLHGARHAREYVTKAVVDRGRRGDMRGPEAKIRWHVHGITRSAHASSERSPGERSRPERGSRTRMAGRSRAGWPGPVGSSATCRRPRPPTWAPPERAVALCCQFPPARVSVERHRDRNNDRCGHGEKHDRIADDRRSGSTDGDGTAASPA